MRQIESRDNALIRHVLRLLRDRRYRSKQDEMVCEGPKMLAEALDSGIRVRTVLLETGREADEALLARAQAQGAQLCAVTKSLLGELSGVETPQGLVFTCARPLSTVERLAGAQRLMLLDGLQDPGNLGTILRTADAFAADGVILCEGCVDPASPKVVRATMGAVFRIPIVSCPLAQAAELVRGLGLPLYATALAQDSVPLSRVPLGKAAVIIGNEGRGVSAQALELCDRKIIIPMRGRAESLNASVAASIVLYEMTREDGGAM
ncbi:MAG: TrmH family RNA methyltransferase [Butyricicoccaceae bacterium]